MNAQKTEIENLYKALDIRDHVIFDLKSQVQSLRQMSQNETLLEDLENMRHENLSYREIISDLQKQLNYTSHHNGETHMECNYWKEKAYKQDELFQSQLQSIEEKEQQLHSAKLENKALIGTQCSLETEIQKLNEYIADLERSEQDLISRLEDNAHQTAILDESYYSLKNDANRFQRLFEDSNVKCVGIERENTLLHQKVQTLQKRLSESENRIVTLTEEHLAESRMLREEIETLRQQDILDGNVHSNTRQNDDLVLELGILESQLISCHAENRSLRRFHEMHYREVAQVKDDYEECLRDFIAKEQSHMEDNYEHAELMSARESRLRQDCLELNNNISELKRQLESSERRNSYYEKENGLHEFVFQHKTLESEAHSLREHIKELYTVISEKDDQIISLSKSVPKVSLGTTSEIQIHSTTTKNSEIENRSNCDITRNMLMNLINIFSIDIGFDEENLRNFTPLQALDILALIISMKVKNESRKRDLSNKIEIKKNSYIHDPALIERLGFHSIKPYVLCPSESVHATSELTNNCSSVERVTSDVGEDEVSHNSSQTSCEEIQYGNRTVDVKTATYINLSEIETSALPSKKDTFVQVNACENDTHVELRNELNKTKEALHLCEKRYADSESNVRCLKRSLSEIECKSKRAQNFAAQSAIKELNELLESKSQLLEKYRHQKNAISSKPLQQKQYDCITSIPENEPMCDNLRKNLIESRSTNYHLQQNFIKLNEAMINLRNDYKRLMESIEGKELKILQKDNEIMQLKNALINSEGRLSAWGNKMKKLKECIQQQTSENAKLASFEAILKSTKEQLYKVTRSKEKMAHIIQSSNDKMIEYEKQISSYEKDINILKSDLTLLRNSNRKLQQKLKKWKALSLTSTAENDLITELNTVQKRVQMLDDEST